MKNSYCVAIVGALGAVGSEMMKILESSTLPISACIPLDIACNVGKELSFRGKPCYVAESGVGAFKSVDIALFSAGAEASATLAPIAVKEGAIVIDNSSQWRMVDEVPLVVPEVNSEALKNHKGIIANPNCSTIQMLVALKPLHDRYNIRRIVVSTYQAVSGSGLGAIEELKHQARDILENRIPIAHVYPHPIAFNAIPHIDVFQDNGYTKEEMKMVQETHKILDPSISVSATAVRIPVFRGHSESINIEFYHSYDLEEATEILRNAPGVIVYDDSSNQQYPLALNVEGKDEVYVGRLRRDPSESKAMNMWVVADNLRKGAALNAVQIAEKLIEMELIS